MEREANVTLMELLEKNDHYHAMCGRNVGTDKEWRHKYISTFYEEHFAKYKDKEINLLEIGTGHGGGLLLWNDYFEKGNIYGVDVNDYTNPEFIKAQPRIKTFLKNGYSTDFAATLPDFDIVIDDGPHTLTSFVECIEVYLSKVKPGGMLVIEDIPDLGYTKALISKTQGHKHTVVDTREISGLSDNIMFVIWK